MGSQTPLRKYPYPYSTDKISQGAVNMEDISEAVENSRALANNAHPAADLYTAYPVGHSQMYITGSGTDNGWPVNYGNVITIYTNTSHGWQWFYPYASPTSANGKVLVRYASSSLGTWTDWFTVVGGNTLPYAMAAGSVTVTPKAGEPKSVAIAMPSGRFPNSTGMRVQLTAGGATHPEDIAVCVYSVNNSLLTVYIWRKTATETTISWQVAQGGAVA